MIFFGVESGNDAALRNMKKQLTAEQTLELARRIREFDIVPEYSMIFGNPDDAERDLAANIAFVRRIKKVNPGGGDRGADLRAHAAAQRRVGRCRGDVSRRRPTSGSPIAGIPFLIRTDPQLPWLPAHVKRRIHDFETVMNSRWPTTQDMRLPGWGRTLLKSLSSWRYAMGAYDFPGELRLAQKLVRLRQPRLESL